MICWHIWRGDRVRTQLLVPGMEHISRRKLCSDCEIRLHMKYPYATGRKIGRHERRQA